MPNIFTVIGEAWEYYRKQPVLNHVILWMLTIPIVLSIWVDVYADYLLGSYAGTENYSVIEMIQEPQGAQIILLSSIIGIFLMLWSTWGISCTILVGKKLLESRAGRSRSSFKSVHKQSLKYVPRLFLTELLAYCFIAFWSLLGVIPFLLILLYLDPQIGSQQDLTKFLLNPIFIPIILLLIPAIIYALRIGFFEIVIVGENLGYRTALNRSKEVVTGKTWHMFGYLFALLALLFLPAFIVIDIVFSIVEYFDVRLLPVVDIIGSGLLSFAAIIFYLSLIILYDAFKKA